MRRILAALCISLLTIGSGCFDNRKPPADAVKYKEGDVVQFKLNGKKVVIIKDDFEHNGNYVVKYLSENGSSSPMKEETVRWSEIEEFKPEPKK